MNHNICSVGAVSVLKDYVGNNKEPFPTDEHTHVLPFNNSFMFYSKVLN